jgi:stalled ribosome rescue protein Dom34
VSRNVGVWVDHARAVIVTVESDEASVTTLTSGVEPRLHYSGGARSKTTYGSQDAGAEKRRDEQHRHHLVSYYDRVIQAVRDAESILIMGPGEAKRELRQRIERSKALAARIADVRACDKLTDAQLVSAVREFFFEQRNSSAR